MSKKPSENKVTSNSAASAASKVLKSTSSSKVANTAAASALSQAYGKKGK